MARVVEALASGSRSYRELGQLPPFENAPEDQLIKGVSLLIESGALLPDDRPAKEAKPGKAFNQALLDQFMAGSSVNQLAAPAAGASVHAGFTDVLALSGIGEGKRDHAATARRGWEILHQTGAVLQCDGRKLSGQAAHGQEMVDRLEHFETEKLPRDQRPGVI